MENLLFDFFMFKKTIHIFYFFKIFGCLHCKAVGYLASQNVFAYFVVFTLIKLTFLSETTSVLTNSVSFSSSNLGAGEIDQWIKCLPCKQHEFSPQYPVKKPGPMVCTYHPKTGRWRQANHWNWLASQPSLLAELRKLSDGTYHQYPSCSHTGTNISPKCSSSHIFSSCSPRCPRTHRDPLSLPPKC